MNVYFSSGGNSNLDSKRGIGANTEELVKELIKLPKVKVVQNINDANIVHFTKFRPYFIDLPFIKPKNQKWILTLHDMTELIYPKFYSSGIKGKIKFVINRYLINKNIDKIITITETSKKDICRFLNINPEKVVVSYLAPKSAIKRLSNGSWSNEIRKRFNLPNKFLMFDHGINYNKNLMVLVKASRLLGMKLVVVGKDSVNLENLVENYGQINGPQDLIRSLFKIPHPQNSHFKKLLDEINNADIARLGYVSDEDLNKLFNLATIYVQPSYYEGFGMPVVEAMSVGCPVICSKTQALVEVAGDACMYFDPNDPKELAEKIKMFLDSERLRNEYIKKGFERVKKFSWKKAALETLEVYAKSI